MNPEKQRSYNTVFGGIFLSVGILAWLGAIFFAVFPNEPAPAPVKAQAPIDMDSCRAALSTLGYSASIENKVQIKAYEALSNDPKEQLEKASLAAVICKVPMREFCMGSGCPRPGVTLTLTAPLDNLPQAKGTTGANAASATKEAKGQASAASATAPPKK